MLLTSDFETTTDPLDCRTWAWGLCEIGNEENFCWGETITEWVEKVKTLDQPTVYFHNLKFDGTFILCWLFSNGYEHVIDKKDLHSLSFTTLISDMGQFYNITIVFQKSGKKTKKVVIYDSLKILPFSVAEIAKGFKLAIKKGKIDYEKFRPEGYKLDENELSYLRNDCTIIASSLHVLFAQKLTKMTQGSNALFDFKNTIGEKKFEMWFPSPPYDADVRQSYKGGFTYLNPIYAGKDIGEGIVLDVNSLYPAVMRNKLLPYGDGIFYKGFYEQDTLYPLYVQMFTCHFELKKGFIPTIQLKNNLSFVPTEYVTTSKGEDVTLCLTSVDYELFLQHYDVYNIEHHSGWKFKATTGLFVDYIDKWSAVKIQSKITGNKAMYTLAKLMLNALYGKFSLNPNVQSKIPYLDSEGIIRFKLGEKEMREPLYIPVGTFVTSWARYITITSAQKVYDRFVYADTDSLHLIGKDIPECLEVSDTELGKWKHECTFEKARFLRAKSYLEYYEDYYEDEDGNKVKFFNHVTCAGMPDRCHENVTWENFHLGKKYTGKLQQISVKGGIILKDVDFTLAA